MGRTTARHGAVLRRVAPAPASASVCVCLRLSAPVGARLSARLSVCTFLLDDADSVAGRGVGGPTA
eukprot:8596926-Lingulodinium_polyedra.AAC.1